METEWCQTTLDCDFNLQGIRRVKDFLREEAKSNQEKRKKAAEEAAKKIELRKTLRFMLGILTKECPAAGDLWKRLEPFPNRKTALKQILFDRLLRWELKGRGRTRQRVYYLPYWKWELTNEHSEYYFPEIAKAVTDLQKTIITHARRKQEEKVREWQQKGHFPLAIRKPEPWHALIPKIENTNPP
jgi:hypothetical protein